MRHSAVRRLLMALPLLFVALSVALLPTRTWAHPLGNFTVNQYSRLDIATNQLRVLYIVDMAEIPTFQERSKIDTDHDDAISATEQAQYLSEQSSVLLGNLHLAVNGTPLTLERQDQTLEFPEGQGGLKTLRFTMHLAAALPSGASAAQAVYRDDNYAGRIGWREIIVRAEDGASLTQSNAPTTDLSNELHNYPQDLLQSPLNLSSVTFSFQPGVSSQGSAGTGQGAGIGSALIGKQQDAFAALITNNELSSGALLVVLLTAFGLGALHALSPGHGKTIVAAYLVGARGTAKHAIFLGLTTTITHTIGVFLLGFITLFVSRFILPEQLYPWLGVISGALVVVIGVSLASGRLRRLRQSDAGPTSDHSHDAIAWLDHEHGPDTHTHLPPTSPSGGRLPLMNLLMLGISGGIIPCPSALVVLLSAIALGRVGFGLLLILMFSIGLASVLTGIGLLLVHAGRLAARIPTRGGIIQILPIVSALIITVVGVGITVQALAQTGLLS